MKNWSKRKKIIIGIVTLLLLIGLGSTQSGDSSNSQSSQTVSGTYISHPMGKSNPLTSKLTFSSNGKYKFESDFGDGYPDYGEWKMTGDDSFKIVLEDIGTVNGRILSSGDLSIDSFGYWEKF